MESKKGVMKFSWNNADSRRSFASGFEIIGSDYELVTNVVVGVPKMLKTLRELERG
jgi:hypothetical protein